MRQLCFVSRLIFVILQIFGVEHEVSLILFSQMDERSRRKNSQGAETCGNGTQKVCGLHSWSDIRLRIGVISESSCQGRCTFLYYSYAEVK